MLRKGRIFYHQTCHSSLANAFQFPHGVGGEMNIRTEVETFVLVGSACVKVNGVGRKAELHPQLRNTLVVVARARLAQSRKHSLSSTSRSATYVSFSFHSFPGPRTFFETLRCAKNITVASDL